MSQYTIYTCEMDCAPARMRWRASFSPLDEGEHPPHGEGPTEHEAMADLCANFDLPGEEAITDSQGRDLTNAIHR